jgi:hypothetical protein
VGQRHPRARRKLPHLPARARRGRLKASRPSRRAPASARSKFDRSRFFALCAENRGFNIQAFTSYEEAMEWLIAG